MPSSPPRNLLIACGALAQEVLDILRLNGWERHLHVVCLPAKLHNRPEQIPERLRAKIRKHRQQFDKIFVAYGDCGTGGGIDQVLAEEGVMRIAGPHCYAFYAGQKNFIRLAEQELGTFYLTDYLTQHFDTLIMEGLGLARHPELWEMLFGHYRRLVYLAQTEDAQLNRKAEQAAQTLGLTYQRIYTGYGELADFIGKSLNNDRALDQI